MRKIILIFLLFPILFYSCRYLDSAPSEEKLLEKELKAINWKQVDAFPSVSECEKIKDTVIRKHCFFEFITHAIQDKLDEGSASMLHFKEDTIMVKVTVFPNATVQFEPQISKDSVTTYNSVKIDSLFKALLVDFPKVHPAIKRGVPVKTQFILPIVLKRE
jgi:hypothetical protein